MMISSGRARWIRTDLEMIPHLGTIRICIRIKERHLFVYFVGKRLTRVVPESRELIAKNPVDSDNFGSFEDDHGGVVVGLHGATMPAERLLHVRNQCL